MKKRSRKEFESKTEKSSKRKVDTTKRPIKRAKKDIIISEGYMDLCSDIEKLKKVIDEPVKTSSLLVGKKKALLLKFNAARVHQKKIIEETMISHLPVKKAYLDRLKNPVVTPDLTPLPVVKVQPLIKPSPTLSDVAVPLLSDVTPVVPPKPEERMIISTPPPSPPRL